MNEIKMIPVDQLFHHPENPRLDLGDLGELTASIKANGILQNLTVVYEPEHDMSPTEWHRATEEYGKHPTEDLRMAMNNKKVPGRYLVVIGNRRLEASKAAGLTELPCSVREMTHQEQIATMLQENMQRSDLTVYEQAKGIQMMMDLGFDKDQIAERTGFSKTTIERRLAVATLPEKEAKAAVGVGYDLIDLVEISKLESRERQQELLTSANLQMDNGEVNRNFLRQRIEQVRREEVRKKEEQRLLPDVKAFAKPLKENESVWNGNWEHVRDLDVELEPEAKVKRPKDDEKYFYRVSYGTIEIFKKLKKEKHVKTEAELAQEKRQHDAKELNMRMKENRIAFVASYSPNKTQEVKLKNKMWDYIFGEVSKYDLGGFRVTYHSWGTAVFRQFCGMPLEEGREKEESIQDEMKRRGIPLGRAILAWILSGGVRADDREGYANTYSGRYQQDEDLDRVYEVLIDAGYVLTDEERQWKDGTHPFFGNEG